MGHRTWSLCAAPIDLSEALELREASFGRVAGEGEAEEGAVAGEEALKAISGGREG